MPIGLVGRKCGMTRVFTEEGVSVPVTVIEVKANRVTQVKSAAVDGYRALQVTTGMRRRSRIGKPVAGHLAKASVEPGRGFWEFRLEEGEGEGIAVSAELKVDMFHPGQKVDVVGTTIGKGFTGTVKRHHFSTQDASHGNSLSHRAPGAIGQRQTPGRVYKGKKMAGHLGNVRRCTQNLEVVRVEADRNLLLVKGAVPGAKGSAVIVRPAVKARGVGGDHHGA
jgi:50S ribosomal protein L3, bacterial